LDLRTERWRPLPVGVAREQAAGQSTLQVPPAEEAHGMYQIERVVDVRRKGKDHTLEIRVLWAGRDARGRPHPKQWIPFSSATPLAQQEAEMLLSTRTAGKRPCIAEDIDAAATAAHEATREALTHSATSLLEPNEALAKRHRHSELPHDGSSELVDEAGETSRMAGMKTASAGVSELSVGMRVQARFEASQRTNMEQVKRTMWFDGSIEHIHIDGTADILYADGDHESRVLPIYIRPGGTLVCPAKHALSHVRVPCDLKCNQCSATIPAQGFSFACFLCDYDRCVQCTT